MYKIAFGKTRTSTRLTTIKKVDGMYTTDTRSTTKHMIEDFVPDDREDSDSELHAIIRKETQETLEMADDKEFTEEEIIGNLRKFNSKKAPGRDGVTSGNLINAFQAFPRFFTVIQRVLMGRMLS